MSSKNSSRQNSSSLSRRQQHNADKRRSANAVGLTDFSQKKGQIRALEEFKKRKNRKHLETSMALRRYRKLISREGMHAGTGASRKRRSEFDGEANIQEKEYDSDGSRTNGEKYDGTVDQERLKSDNQNDIDGSDNDSDVDNEKLVKTKQKKPQKMDPFQKSRERAKLAKQQAEEAVLRRESNEKERQQKLKRRKQQTKLLQQRTKRGQPIMKHAINNLLYKLEMKNKNKESPTKPDNDDRPRRIKKRGFSKTQQTQNDESSPKKKKKRARKFY